MPTFSNIFSSETTGPIEATFHVEPPWDGGTKVCSNGPGHMTKVAAMPILQGHRGQGHWTLTTINHAKRDECISCGLKGLYV